MRNLFLIVFAVSALMMACTDAAESDADKRKDGFSAAPQTREDSLYHEVMEGHDIGMAKIGQVKKYLNQVKHLRDSVGKLPASKVDETYQQNLMDMEEDLNYADYSMFTWMEEFKADTLKDNKEQRIKYLEAEKEKVMKVKESILGSIHRADSILNKK